MKKAPKKKKSPPEPKTKFNFGGIKTVQIKTLPNLVFAGRVVGTPVA